MPFAIDEEKMVTDPLQAKPGAQPLVQLDPAKPPVKVIPHLEFPRIVYKHPKEPFYKVEHRNAQREVVDVEFRPAEHKTLKVNDAKELAAALKEGWVKEPYIAPEAKDPNSDLY